MSNRLREGGTEDEQLEQDAGTTLKIPKDRLPVRKLHEALKDRLEQSKLTSALRSLGFSPLREDYGTIIQFRFARDLDAMPEQTAEDLLNKALALIHENGYKISSSKIDMDWQNEVQHPFRIIVIDVLA